MCKIILCKVTVTHLEKRQDLDAEKHLLKRHSLDLRDWIFAEMVVVTEFGVQMEANTWHHTASSTLPLKSIRLKIKLKD